MQLKVHLKGPRILETDACIFETDACILETDACIFETDVCIFATDAGNLQFIARF